MANITKKYAHKKLFFGVSVFDLDNIDILKKLDIDFLKLHLLKLKIYL